MSTWYEDMDKYQMEYEQRREDVINVRLLGAPAKSASAWLSAIDKAERAGEPCPNWDELEKIAPSTPIEPIDV